MRGTFLSQHHLWYWGEIRERWRSVQNNRTLRKMTGWWRIQCKTRTNIGSYENLEDKIIPFLYSYKIIDEKCHDYEGSQYCSYWFGTEDECNVASWQKEEIRLRDMYCRMLRQRNLRQLWFPITINRHPCATLPLPFFLFFSLFSNLTLNSFFPASALLRGSNALGPASLGAGPNQNPE